MKKEEQIREEIKKHKEAITHPFSERTQEEKIHSWIISTLAKMKYKLSELRK